ncbi:uncharacterized protein LOC134719756 [Mytilus trossulus]|uniref:uncharacterized protein LOC134719756 n=1 Tax=Mytilus trossulus TaxID=6551 RepID=UPI0030050152
MAYFKLTILVITIVIGLQHGPVHVSCQFFPPAPGIGAFQPPGIPPALPPNARLIPIPVPVPQRIPRRGDDDRRRQIVLVNGGGPGPFPQIGGGMGLLGALLPLLILSALLGSFPIPTPAPPVVAPTPAAPVVVTVLVTPPG